MMLKRKTIGIRFGRSENLLVGIPLLVSMLFLAVSVPVLAQSEGVWMEVKAGFPESLVADGESTTVLEVGVEDAPCWRGAVPTNVIFTVMTEVSRGRLAPPTTTTETFPVELLYTAGLEPGPVEIQVTVTYCPEGAVSIMGVCSEQSAADISCTGSLQLALDPPVPVGDVSEDPPVVEAEPEQAEPPSAESRVEEDPVDADPQAVDVSSLIQDLEAFLSTATGEVDVGRVAAGGGAVASLILIWVLLQRQQGIDEARLMQSVRAWRQGDGISNQPRPATLPELEHRPDSLPEMDGGRQSMRSPGVGEMPREPADARIQARPLSPEGIAARVHRAGQDLADGLQALRGTLDQSSDLKKKIENEVPPAVRDSPAFRRASGLFDTVIKKVEQISNVDQAKRMVDEFNQHANMHREVDRQVPGRVSEEGRQSIKVLQSTIQGATEAPMRVSDKVHETIAASGEAALRPFSQEAARSFRQAVEEEKRALQNVREEVVQLPTKASKVVTKGVFGEHYRQAEVNNPELEGIRGEGAFPRPERPDFGRGWRKAERAYRALSDWVGGLFR